jgi:hypothetical protein
MFIILSLTIIVPMVAIIRTQVSALTVRRVAILVASAAFHLQAAQLRCMTRRLTDPASNAGVELEFAVLTIMWDETQQTVSLAAAAGTSSGQQSSTWQTCVMKFRLIYGWCGAVFVYDYHCPPIPLISNAGKHIYSAMMAHPVCKPMWSFARACFQKSKYNAILHFMDGCTFTVTRRRVDHCQRPSRARAFVSSTTPTICASWTCSTAWTCQS